MRPQVNCAQCSLNSAADTYYCRFRVRRDMPKVACLNTVQGRYVLSIDDFISCFVYGVALPKVCWWSLVLVWQVACDGRQRNSLSSRSAERRYRLLQERRSLFLPNVRRCSSRNCTQASITIPTMIAPTDTTNVHYRRPLTDSFT